MRANLRGRKTTAADRGEKARHVDRVVQLRAVGTVVNLDEGIFALTVAVAARGSDFTEEAAYPIGLSAPPADGLDPVEIVTSTGKDPAWLPSTGGTVVVDAPRGGGVLLITTHTQPGAPASEIAVTAHRLGASRRPMAAPSIASQPAADPPDMIDAPVAADAPALVDAPVAADVPAVMDTPVVSDTSVADTLPVSADPPPAAADALVAEDEPLADDVGQQPAVPEEQVAVTEEDDAVAASITAAEPRRVPIDISLHVGVLGDSRFPADDWVRIDDVDSPIEAFALHPGDEVLSAAIEYMAFGPAGRETDWRAGGAWCGTRGRATPLTGFAMRVVEDQRDRLNIEYEGSFAEGGTVGPIADGAPCASPITDDPLKAMRVRLTERESA